MERLRGEAREVVEERILDILIGPEGTAAGAGSPTNKSQRGSFRGMLRDGLLENQEIEVDVPENMGQAGSGKDGEGAVFAVGSDSTGINMQVISEMMRKMGGGAGQRRGPPTERKRMAISEAREIILEIELEKAIQNSCKAGGKRTFSSFCDLCSFCFLFSFRLIPDDFHIIAGLTTN